MGYRLSLLLALTLLLAACGQKGDLFFPDSGNPPADTSPFQPEDH